MARGKSQQRRGNGVMEAAEARIVQAIFLFRLFISLSIHVDRPLTERSSFRLLDQPVIEIISDIPSPSQAVRTTIKDNVQFVSSAPRSTTG